MADPRLELRGGCASVGSRELFADLHLSLGERTGPGQLCVVIGPNGAGKSTLLKLLGGLSPPRKSPIGWSGEVRLAGSALASLGARERARRVALLVQRESRPFEYSVREYVALGRLPHLGPFARMGPRDHAQVELALEELELGGFAERSMGSLSGGEAQRVRLARLVASEAQILLLDEPTTALDVGHALELFRLLRRQCEQGRTVLAAVHELELARREADRVLCLDPEGGPGWQGSADAIMRPEVLDRAFGVETVLGPGGALSFHPRKSRGPRDSS